MTDSSNGGGVGRVSLIGAGIALLAGLPAQAGSTGIEGANYLIVPQSRAFAFQRRAKPVRIQEVAATISIVGQAAVTRLEVVVHNPSPRQEEAVLLLPVPNGAVVSGFTFAGSASSSRARLLPRDEARRTYEKIVRRLRDPALLEFAGIGLVRSSVFPVPAGGRQRISMSFEAVLPADGNRVDYVLPRSASLQAMAPWRVAFRIRDDQPISMVYSPSHGLETVRKSDRELRVKISRQAARDPGPIRLSFLRAGTGAVSASMFTYPDAKAGGGYFLLVANLPKAAASRRQAVRREVTLVLDRSGSVAGPKLDQIQAAALQVIEGLDQGERFNIVDYATQVASFGRRGVVKSRASVIAARHYLEGLRPMGGTNIHEALVRALQPAPQPGTLPIVLFLTDGVPTVHVTDEQVIRDLVRTQNRHQRRIFTIGVGHDVNVPLLDAVADLARGTATYVRPDEDVELAVTRVFRKLAGPVLEGPELTAVDSAGREDTRRLRALQPTRLADVYADEQIIVLGQYRGHEPLRLRLRGRYLGQPREFALRFSLRQATTRNSFVPRLWAARQIAYLVDQVRGAGASHALPVQGADPFRDPRLREIREEILRLSTEFGVLSEYTAFLATEGSTRRSWADLQRAVGSELDAKAIKLRSGAAAVNQSINYWNGKNRSVANPRNVWLNDAFEPVETKNVQQIHDRAFFRRGTGWIDGRLLRQGDSMPTRVVRLGSPDYRELLNRLMRQGREGVLSLRGEIVFRVDGEVIRVVNR